MIFPSILCIAFRTEARRPACFRRYLRPPVFRFAAVRAGAEAIDLGKAPSLLQAIPATSGVSFRFAADRAGAEAIDLGNLSLVATLPKSPVDGIAVSLAETSVGVLHCHVVERCSTT